MQTALRLATITLDPRDGHAVAVFADDRERALPLWVDDATATALATASRGGPQALSTPGGLLVAAVAACGGAVDRCELTGISQGVLRAHIVVVGTDVAVLSAPASLAAQVAFASGAPLLIDTDTLAHLSDRLTEAQARQSYAKPTLSDTQTQQTTADRWNALLEHLAERLHDDRPS